MQCIRVVWLNWPIFEIAKKDYQRIFLNEKLLLRLEVYENTKTIASTNPKIDETKEIWIGFQNSPEYGLENLNNTNEMYGNMKNAFHAVQIK